VDSDEKNEEAKEEGEEEGGAVVAAAAAAAIVVVVAVVAAAVVAADSPAKWAGYLRAAAARIACSVSADHVRAVRSRADAAARAATNAGGAPSAIALPRPRASAKVTAVADETAAVVWESSAPAVLALRASAAWAEDDRRVAVVAAAPRLVVVVRRRLAAAVAAAAVVVVMAEEDKEDDEKVRVAGSACTQPHDSQQE
jgi:hypothetical protein